MIHEYSLEEGSKKYECPNCNKKRYVRYVNNRTKEYADYQFGRCDREQECAYHRYPTNSTIDTPSYFTNNKPTMEISYVSSATVKSTLCNYEDNSLVTYLKTVYNEKMVDDILAKYMVGTSDKYEGSPIFWQIDEKNKVRSGKIMGYDMSTGKRIKANDSTPQITYFHSATNLPNFNFTQCMFGAHLIKDNEINYAVVESEKTALIMSLELPEYTWLSVNGKGGFKESMLKPLKDKKIVAYPDKGCYKDWNEMTNKLNEVGYNIHISSLVENLDVENGADVADVFLEFNIK